MAEKQFLDTDGLQTLWGRVKSEDAKVLDSRMARDGSNYEGSLLLVTPTISDYRWTIKAQDGTTKSTITNDLSIQVENGAKVDFAGVVADPKIVAPGYALPEEKAVGGVKNSQHMTGEAADLIIEVEDKTAKEIAQSTCTKEIQSRAKERERALRDLFDLIDEHGVYDQLLWERKGKTHWVHVSYTQYHNRRQKIDNYKG